MPTRLADLLKAGARCDRSSRKWRETLAFHADNPHIYARLRDLCEGLRAKGFTFYSMRTLVCVLRFETDLASTGQDVWIDGELRKVTLNDHHSPYYARMLIEEDPSYAEFFELRSAEGDPVDPVDPLTVAVACPPPDADPAPLA